MVGREAYAVDVMIAAVRAISGTEPIYFQRGGFFAVAPNVVGKLSYGLSLTPENPNNERWREELPEIVASEDAFEGKKEGRKIKSSEVDYFKPLVFHEDSGGEFSIKSINEGLKDQLSKLKDDGKIRMVDHYSQYHSHKHGYACDGSDIFLTEARVMSREKYLELIRKDEEEFLEYISKEENDLRKVYSDSEVRYMSSSPVRIPDVTIITPNLMASLPRLGKLNLDERKQGWTIETDLSGGTSYRDIESTNESPFSISVKYNIKSITAKDGKQLDMEVKSSLSPLTKELDAFRSVMPRIENYLGRINSAHNLGCGKKIEEHRRFLLVLEKEKKKSMLNIY